MSVDTIVRLTSYLRDASYAEANADAPHASTPGAGRADDRDRRCRDHATYR